MKYDYFVQICDKMVFITVEAVRRGEAIVSCKGKTRTVFIVSELRKKLLRYAKVKRIETGAIFVTKNGKPLNRSNIWYEMKSICQDAGVSPTKVFPHNLRHLFARVFYSLEKDVAKLADILGHSSINTTRIYIISTGAEHRRFPRKTVRVDGRVLYFLAVALSPPLASANIAFCILCILLYVILRYEFVSSLISFKLISRLGCHLSALLEISISSLREETPSLP